MDDIAPPINGKVEIIGQDHFEVIRPQGKSKLKIIKETDHSIAT